MVGFIKKPSQCSEVKVETSISAEEKQTTITYQDFYKSFWSIRENVPSYRLGQHFVNMFVKDSNTRDKLFEGLYNKTGDEAMTQICKIIEAYQWDLQKLPVVNRNI